MKERIKINATISSCMIQAFTGIPFLLALAGMLMALLIGGFSSVWSAFATYKNELLDYGMHFTVLQKALQSETVCLMLPVVCSLPFSAAFLEDISCGFIKSYLPRAGRGHYIAGKITAAGISGGSAAAIGVALYYQMLRLLLLPMEKAAMGDLAGLSYGKDVGRVCVLFFCAGMLFSLIGMLFSIVTLSKYMAYASAFVLEYVLIILRERYLKELFVIDPREWLHPQDAQWMFGELGAVLLMVLLIVLVVMVLIVVMMRRIGEI